MNDERPAVLIGVDKPAGPSSHDVVARIRRALGVKRVGHAGTLDPLATGVLIAGVGQAARLLGYIALSEKSYVAEFRFGSETLTDDAEGEVTATAPVPERIRDRSFAASRVRALVGKGLQVPPAVSAVKKDGRRAWRAARRGESLELEPRPVEIFDAALCSVDATDEGVSWTVSLTVSKGFYVRSLARDLGRELGCPAHVAKLVRTRSGHVGLSSCLELEAIEEEGWDAVRTHWLDPFGATGIARRDLSASELARALDGKPLRARDSDAELVGLFREGRLWGVWERSGGVLRCRANFPDGILASGDAAASRRGGVGL